MDVTITWLQNDMLVSQRTARETNITRHSTANTWKKLKGDFRKEGWVEEWENHGIVQQSSQVSYHGECR